VTIQRRRYHQWFHFDLLFRFYIPAWLNSQHIIEFVNNLWEKFIGDVIFDPVKLFDWSVPMWHMTCHRPHQSVTLARFSLGTTSTSCLN
jgi:hypothetical protein